MQYSYSVVIEEFPKNVKAHRLAVGDVIRCPAFRLGHLTPKNKDLFAEAVTSVGAEPITRVAWRSQAQMDHYVNWQNSTTWGKDSMIPNNDESRGQALFLITCIGLRETWGPEDVGAPALLYREIHASRLRESNSSFYLEARAERICFCQDDPMACCSPNPEYIEMFGHGTIQTAW
jgi:hypothetical protein